jgi:hypothetical protein
MEELDIDDDVVVDTVIDAFTRMRGFNRDEIRRKLPGLTAWEKRCIMQYFDIDEENVGLAVMMFWLETAKPVLDALRRAGIQGLF